VTLVYTQANINDDNSVVASFGTVGLQYTLATNTLTLSNNTTLLSQTQNPNFWCADGIVVDPQNGNFLVAGCGDDTLPGSVFQLTPNGAEASPFSFSFSPPLIAYSDFALTIVPANGSQSGFQPGTLLATEKEFGFDYVVIYPLSPTISNGEAYPVTGDDVDVDSVAFDGNGNAYYASGTPSSNDGNFGTITFNGTEFVTHRLTPKLLTDAYAPAHRLCYDSLTGDIFSVGGNEVAQYEPRTNIFHVLSISPPPNYSFGFNNVTTDGSGHALVADGGGYLILVDYSQAAGNLIDASSGVQYNYSFLAASLGSVLISSTGSTSGGGGQTQCPCTIWSSSTVPSKVDNGPDSSVELGVAFQATTNGTISGVRFYKASTNTGTHVGNLWSSTGTLLASATFTNETSSGWQQVNFSSPVNITAGTTYIASYHTTVGHWSGDHNYFASAGVSNPPLQALESGSTQGNGVYMYGSTSSFPKSTYLTTNYWVDVVFEP